MFKNIEELMAAVNCKKWPERWTEIYDGVLAEFKKNGCEYATPEYYDSLAEKYNVLVKYREVYKKAAEEVGKNEALSLFLALLCASLADREHIHEDLGQFSRPKTVDGSHDLAYDMLTGLAICTQMDYCYSVLKARDIPEDIITSVLRLPENGVYEYMKRNDGHAGYHLLSWFQLAIEGKLFRIGRLEIELFSTFGARAYLFVNSKGEYIALAHDAVLHRSGFSLGAKWYEDEEGSFSANVEETEDAWIGYPYDEKGFVKKEKVMLSKFEWKKIAERSTPAIRLHIPGNEKLVDEDVAKTLKDTREFVNKYYPEFKDCAFVCHSWLLDPQLVDMLGEDSNISKFCKRFNPITSKSGGNAVFGFVFLRPDDNYTIEELPENTRLERALKKHYLNSKAIYEMHGYFF